jgi:hypothetical protein
VQTLNSPFNTCEEISTDDLHLAQAHELYNKVCEKGDEETVGAAFDLVDGNPYLLQTIFDKIHLAPEDEKALIVGKTFEFMHSGQDKHFQ